VGCFRSSQISNLVKVNSVTKLETKLRVLIR